ncbi:MAG: hypothetical protein HN353_08420 [Bdellovibrionales bacterium]|nr:hypothetical protein [Bdellovibrionales bacterium]MBT3526564.1 hypothetical protein [Bdellovibrionales bacterium]MBT7669767.1 hypothetical protein [Bdellovibrionales bacterium]
MDTTLRLKDIFRPMLITLVLLILLEVFSSTVMPILGILNYRLPFNILIIIYMGFRVQSSTLAIQVLAVQYIHSMFTIEGWGIGTIAGVIICMIISYLREIVHLSSWPLTILVTMLFQLVWFIISASMLLIKSVGYAYILDKFWHMLPEGLVISLMAPLFFILMDKIWQSNSSDSQGDI